jgi:pimeloyl-ACP methyl ester carboxylesterase
LTTVKKTAFGPAPSSVEGPSFIELAVDGFGAEPKLESVTIEYAWLQPQPGADTEQTETPLVVFLHEGLGSLSMWKAFPQAFCNATGARGLVYSRPGYGRSTPRPDAQAWGPQFMHHQAHVVLPALLRALSVNPALQRVWLLGHSDGGSIALLHAAHAPDAVAGLIVLAPHIMVEALSITSIQKARDAYVQGDLKTALARHHRDPDSAFWGWNNAWLNPAFRAWSIEAELGRIACPVLAIQGSDDVYGTLDQIKGIAERAPRAHWLEFASCGHSPHRDQPQRLLDEAARFMRMASTQRPTSSP